MTDNLILRKFYIFRHGQTDWNVAGRIQGHLDVPLNDTGRAQARRIAPHLHRLGIQAVLSSDLSRAKETAEIVATVSGVPVYEDSRLREIFLGEVQGLTRSEIENKFGQDLSHRLRTQPLTDIDVASLGSESGDEVIRRAIAAISAFFQTHPHLTSIGVSTHGGVIRRVVQAANPREGFPPPIPNGVVYPIQYHPPGSAPLAANEKGPKLSLEPFLIYQPG